MCLVIALLVKFLGLFFQRGSADTASLTHTVSQCSVPPACVSSLPFKNTPLLRSRHSLFTCERSSKLTDLQLHALTPRRAAGSRPRETESGTPRLVRCVSALTGGLQPETRPAIPAWSPLALLSRRQLHSVYRYTHLPPRQPHQPSSSHPPSPPLHPATRNRVSPPPPSHTRASFETERPYRKPWLADSRGALPR